MNKVLDLVIGLPKYKVEPMRMGAIDPTGALVLTNVLERKR